MGSFLAVGAASCGAADFLVIRPVDLPARAVYFSIMLVSAVGLALGMFLGPLSLPNLVSVVFLWAVEVLASMGLLGESVRGG